MFLTLLTANRADEKGSVDTLMTRHAFERRHGKDLAFIVPARDLFMVGAVSDRESVSRKRKAVQDFCDGSTCRISPLVYRYTDGEFSMLSR